MKAVKKTGGYELLYFEIVSTIALLTMLVVFNVVQAGAGVQIDPPTLHTLGTDCQHFGSKSSRSNDQYQSTDVSHHISHISQKNLVIPKTRI
jgi:Na+/H+-dicarboxylate symporter